MCSITFTILLDCIYIQYHLPRSHSYFDIHKGRCEYNIVSYPKHVLYWLFSVCTIQINLNNNSWLIICNLSPEGSRLREIPNNKFIKIHYYRILLEWGHLKTVKCQSAYGSTWYSLAKGKWMVHSCARYWSLQHLSNVGLAVKANPFFGALHKNVFCKVFTGQSEGLSKNCLS